MILIDIPGLGKRELHRVVSDYTGTHAFSGTLRPGVKERLTRLAELVEIHFLTSDTFGTAKRELESLPVSLHLLSGKQHDKQKQAFVADHEPQHVVAFGNGNNDRLMLRTVRTAEGLAIAVDNGEGCAIDTMVAANLFINGSEQALDLLLNPDRCKATLRF